MARVDTLVGTVSMLVMTSMPWCRCLLLATVVPGAYIELLSRGGNDTVTVPVVNTVVLFGVLSAARRITAIVRIKMAGIFCIVQDELYKISPPIQHFRISYGGSII